MRHSFIVLAAAGIFTLLSVSEASAQRFGFGSRGGRGFSNGYGNGGYNGGYYGAGNGGYYGGGRGYYGGGNYFPNSYGYSNFGNQYGGYGSSIRLGNFGISQYSSSPYNSQSYYTQPYGTQSYSSQPYFTSGSGYSTMSNPCQDVTSTMPMMSQSMYQSNNQAYATISVTVPTADSQVWFGETLMSQEGTNRTYQSTLLDAGTTYAYTITARWQQDGRAQEQIRKVEVFAGKSSEVKFGMNRSQVMPSPTTSNGK